MKTTVREMRSKPHDAYVNAIFLPKVEAYHERIENCIKIKANGGRSVKSLCLSCS
jgi:hypothetical protein